MKNLYLYLLAALFCLPVGTRAQTLLPDGIRIGNATAQKANGLLNLSMDIRLDDLHLPSQEMVVLTPALQSPQDGSIYKFPPVVITGAERHRALKRYMESGAFRFEQAPAMIVRRHNRREQNIRWDMQYPYAPELRNARLIVLESRMGCNCKDDLLGEFLLMPRLLPAPYIPDYRFAYIIPDTEPVKRREETYVAELNFQLAKYEILDDYKDNARALEKIRSTIDEIRNDPNLEFQGIRITGYASPEGNFQYNMNLSKNRALSFAKYLTERFGIPATDIKTDWKGEDWEGLRAEIEKSALPDKAQLLEIIDNNSDIPVRERKIQALSGGAVYRTLLNEYYPPLRRNEYTVSYIARPFKLNEARRVIETNPRYLSLNEMYLVAESYPKDSPQFRRAFETIARLYPDDPQAQLNTASFVIANAAVRIREAEILKEENPSAIPEENFLNLLTSSAEFEKAVETLSALDNSGAWNNLGIAWALRRKYARAAEYFQKAAEAGLEVAVYNAGKMAKKMTAE